MTNRSQLHHSHALIFPHVGRDVKGMKSRMRRSLMQPASSMERGPRLCTFYCILHPSTLSKDRRERNAFRDLSSRPRRRMIICFPVTYALSISTSVYWVIQLDLIYLLGLSLSFVSFDMPFCKER